jgi:hypothetical protein
MSRAKTGAFIIADGACRFMELSSGVWTDATGKKSICCYGNENKVRAYNIIGRSTRYLDQKALKHRDLHESLHEQVMHLMAITRIIIWVPLPLGIVACKVIYFYMTRIDSLDLGKFEPESYLHLGTPRTFSS